MQDKIEMVKKILLDAMLNRDTAELKIKINQGGIVQAYYDKKII